MYNCHQEIDLKESNDLKDQLSRAVIIKNIERSFNEEKIDFYNYHKKVEFYDNLDPLEIFEDPITSFE